MATKTFYLDWMGQYTASTNNYYGGGSPIRVGGSSDYQSYVGFPSAVRDALKTSKTSTTLKIKLYVTDPAEFDFGAHKETYNKGTGSMPWYKYIGLHPTLGSGWNTVDLTSAFMNSYEAGTYHGLVMYGIASSSGYGVASNTGSTRAIIEVGGDWNDPPNTPNITYPNGGETVDKSITLKWTVYDPDGDSTKFTLAYKEGDGSSWQYVDTGYGVSQYTFDTSGWAEGSSAQFAVKASDGQEWSGYDYSNKFTINHNQSPSAPTQLSPSNGDLLNRNDVIRFSWKHNDDGNQAGYRLAWRTVSSSGVVGDWTYLPNDTGFTNTINQYYNMPAGTLPFSEIQWTVKTKDQQGLGSPYSVHQQFKASEPTNAPTILTPTNGVSTSVTNVNVTWSSLNQLEYELTLYDSDGAQLWQESKSGGTKLVEIPYDLSNNSTYEVHLRVKDSESLIWSDWSYVVFHTDFNPPMKPSVTATEEAGEGVINVFYTAGLGTEATHVEAQRREYTPTDTAPWVTIHKDLSLDGSFLDFTPASGVNYEYRVKAINSGNQTSSNSDSIQVMVEFSQTLIQEAHNLESVMVLPYAYSRDGDFNIDSALQKYAGRRDPVREYGENEEQTLSIEWEVDTYFELKQTMELLRKRDVLLYRDGNGRRMWVSADALEYTDKTVKGFVLSMTMVQTSYEEDLNKQGEELI
jgi:hypothetical protein